MNRFKSAFLGAFLAVGLMASSVASAASIVYDGFFTNLFAGNILVNSHSFKCMLLTSSYTADKGAHANRSQLSNEASGTGYTAGGTACTVAGAVNTTAHTYSVTVTGPSWPSSTISARYMAVYKNSGTASTDYLLFLVDFGSTITSSASTFNTTVSSPFVFNN